MNKFLTRSISGIVYAGLFIGATLVNHHILFILLFAFNIIGISECRSFLDKKNNLTVSIILSSTFFVISHLTFTNVISAKWQILYFILPFVYIVYSTFRKYNIVKEISADIFPIIYVTLPLILLNQINISHSEEQFPFVLAVLVLIWSNDSLAYLAGISFGKHKLIEHISPKKTWEGFFGGVIGSLAVAHAISYFNLNYNSIEWIALGLLIAVFSVIGDLFESALKRQAGIKDSGKIIPGHGGLLDRIDSLIFVSPAIYIFLQFT